MEDWLTAPFGTLWKTAAGGVLIMAALLLIIRVYGLRSFAKMSSVDFASTVAIGSILASVTMSTDNSVLKGAVAILAILGFQQVFSIVKRKSNAFESVAENSPKFLMRGTKIIQANMDASGVTHSDLMAKLREANVTQLSQIKAVVFETTGDISVLHGTDDTPIQEEILEGVVMDFPSTSVFQ